ncbi:hypothetical protein GUITHDRAFT_152413 [Guillardia theta CCMP2712]|uniref:Uncharacterized protein n=1 Tax=Guillardia theta (strain CCMP2712) TaxID=905079 RepID=L1JDI3_GUITC|nr:hypothetical protein GUITHDRAFT_152413 [Guillardia theta CCMP2712]EKX46174.1 hypothetical protein GUITHDRAFT_152413 [Guillardia theta CCMP2712]|eukprot:XP_005833154.1 hypothetical protein GUITHDRAFT_152413 [Guillardia theta CCMP2712]
MLMAAALGGYHMMMKRFEQDALASSQCEKNATAAKDLQQENARLVAKLDKLTKQYQKLLTYMKEKCDMGGGDPTGKMSSLCSTELDVCKGNLVEARAELKACSGYAEKIDDKNLQLKQNLTKIKEVDKRMLGETGALIDKLMRSNFSRAEKDKRLKSMIEKNLDDEESQLSSIFKSNGINLGRKNIDFLSKLSKNRSTSENNFSKLTNATSLVLNGGKDGKFKIQLNLGNGSKVDVKKLRDVLPSILKSLPLPLQPLARQLQSDVKKHQQELKVLDGPRRKKSKVDTRPDPAEIFRGMMQNFPSSMIANHPVFSRMGGLFPSRGRNPDDPARGEPFNPFSRMQRARGDDDDEEDDDKVRRSRISLPFPAARSPFQDRSSPMFPSFPGHLRPPFQNDDDND